jgi:hypothetical protein
VADTKTYSSELSDYLDAALASAEREKQRAASRPYGSTGAVAGDITETVFGTLRANLIRTLILRGPFFAIALLPLLAVGTSALLNAVGQGSFAGFPAPVALVGLALFLPWQAWQSIRRARGLPPRRLFGRSNRDHDYDLPPLEEVAESLVSGLAALPALVVVAWAISLPGFIFWGLVALPVALTVLIIVVRSTLSGLGAVGGVDTGDVDLILERPPASLAALDERIVRLTQMREWLRDDALRTMVDDVIGHHVRASERRQVIYSVVVGVASLAAGWLLSALSPVSTLLGLFNR